MGIFQKIGYFPGVWDFLHAGHVMALEEAKEHCDYLIVGLGGNPKGTAIMSIYERYRMLRANKFVDAIVIYETEEESKKLDEWLPYDVRFMGEDHKGEHKHIKRPIIYISRKHNYSSTNIRHVISNIQKKGKAGKNCYNAGCTTCHKDR